ncbi:MAG TPA: hypothetical protein VN788_06670 [Verrucomicrobiae bacterium]|nr:hypothetical protein [Verrucomicrobiae bacterium]
MRLGLNYVRGLTEQSARAIVDERSRRPFACIQDLGHCGRMRRRWPMLKTASLKSAGRPDCGWPRRSFLRLNRWPEWSE